MAKAPRGRRMDVQGFGQGSLRSLQGSNYYNYIACHSQFSL